MPLIETYMALGSTSNWAEETEQKIFEEFKRWKKVRYSTPEPRKQSPYIPLKCKDCNKKLLSMRDNTLCLTCGDMLSEEYNWIDVAMREGVCDQTCQYVLLISEKVKRGTLFDAAYNSVLNKLYYYPHNAEMIFNLAMALVNRATKEDVQYIEYTIELAGFDYKDEVEVYHQIAKQMNIRLCEECIMPCDKQWCPECYALSILLPIKDDQHEIKFEIQYKEPEKAHEINTGYDLRYPEKDTLILQPKSLTRINLKIALEIPSGMMVQIASQSFLASKGINIRGGIIDARYTGDITVMLQNETDKSFKIEHAEKIAQAIYLPLINISDLQLVNQREQLGKSERGTQDFGSTGQFIVPNESHQILRLPQPITILLFGEHHKIYICRKLTTTQQIFEASKQICTKNGISIPNIYLPKRMKKVRVTFYNPNHHPIILLNNLEIEIIHNKIFQQELPQTVFNFLEIIGHFLPRINPKPSSENYHIVVEKLSRINMEQLEPQQQNQLKELITEHANIFAKNNNDLGRTDLV
ncbi:hypothetical protein G9A89_020406 [Geosiphon pyriformis]|nr:hypothetical protein G9A89_020406 [Geosiphon pyriformis]